MGTKIAEVDTILERAPEFARPILERVRADFHAGNPSIREELKWGNPSFVLGTIVGGMAAFKKHVTISFWRGAELDDPEGLLEGVGKTSMRLMKVSSVDELPSSRVLRRLIKQAIALDAATQASAPPRGGKKKATKKKATKRKPAKALTVPKDLLALLAKHPDARATFEGFSQSHRNEYIEWIEEAKRLPTREKRLNTTIEWLDEGKSRNWRYQ